MSAATQNEMERLERVNREQQQLLDQVWEYVDQQGLARLGQSRVAALIEAHQRAAAERDALAAQNSKFRILGGRLRQHFKLFELIGAEARRHVLAWDDADAEPPATSLARLKDERAVAIQRAVKQARLEWAREDKAELDRLKAGWQAAALETAVITAQIKGQTGVARWLQGLADTCRRQAEERNP